MSSPKKQKFDLSTAEKVVELEKNLTRQLNTLDFKHPVAYVYNPLEYAAELHYNFLTKYCGEAPKKIIFLGMNPGPWGMAQTAIPFGYSKVVKEWLKVEGQVVAPNRQYSGRPITGLECNRSEVSGKRFWDFFRKLCETPDRFFKNCFVYNVCPLFLINEKGTNITPSELKGDVSKTLNSICDKTFNEILTLLQPDVILAIGKYAEKRANFVLKERSSHNIKVIAVPHPSPRNLTCKDWPSAVLKVLKEANLLEYFQ